MALAWVPVGCVTMSTQSADISRSVCGALEEAGLHGVTVSQDRDKGIVILSGRMAEVGQMLRAESIAATIAGAQVVWNQIEVIPPDNYRDAKQVKSLRRQSPTGGALFNVRHVEQGGMQP